MEYNHENSYTCNNNDTVEKIKLTRKMYVHIEISKYLSIL